MMSIAAPCTPPVHVRTVPRLRVGVAKPPTVVARNRGTPLFAKRAMSGESHPEDTPDVPHKTRDLHLHSATPTSATIVRDSSGLLEMVYDVELPALDMGIVFREGPGDNVAVVDSVIPDSAAAKTMVVEPGDVLVRTTATVFGDEEDESSHESTSHKKPPLVTMGGPWIGTQHRTISFECLGSPFETQMAAIQSTGIIDAGFVKRTIRLEFMRALDDERDLKYGHPEAVGHPVTLSDYDNRA